MNAVDADTGNTLLHYVIINNNHIALLQYLLAIESINVLHENKQKVTALDLAVKRAYLVYAEQLDPFVLAGGAIVVSANVFNMWSEHRRRTSVAPS